MPGLNGVTNVAFLSGLFPALRGVKPSTFFAGVEKEVLGPASAVGKAAFSGVLNVVGLAKFEPAGRLGFIGDANCDDDDPDAFEIKGDLKGLRLVNGLPMLGLDILNAERTGVGVSGTPGCDRGCDEGCNEGWESGWLKVCPTACSTAPSTTRSELGSCEDDSPSCVRSSSRGGAG